MSIESILDRSKPLNVLADRQQGTTPESCELHSVTRVRVYVSAGTTDRRPPWGALASDIEGFFGARGSSVQTQTGRWHGVEEPGAVIEVCVDFDSFASFEAKRTFGRFLRRQLDPYGLTAYVTFEDVLGMEVY